jgi:peptide/nickel transport system substrate-binding protein
MSRRTLRALSAVVLVGVLAGAVSHAGTTARERDGGIFRISFQGISLAAFDHVDPALAYSRESWTLLDTVCARLMTYPDRPPPEGYTVVPEVAAGFPKISADGRTYTFRLRRGFRFSDGSPVRASAFAHAINRSLAPRVNSPALRYTQAIVGAEDVRAGRTPGASGVVARGNTLVVRFTREVRDFAAWTTMPFFCAVPPTLPADPEGVRSFPGAGPYYVKEYRANERVVVRRNRYYGGKRVHQVDGFDVDLSAGSPQELLDRIEAEKADWGYALAGQHLEAGRNLLTRYRSRFFLRPGLTLRMYVPNSSRPLFRDNARLRRAVNLALDRFSFGHPASSEWTDQYLPPHVPGYRNRSIYPLGGDPQRAKALADGHTRGGKAVLYVPDFAQPLATAQLVRQQLAEIGLEIEIRTFAEHATSSAYLGRLGNANEPWDLALVLWTPDFIDPSGYINQPLGSQFPGGTDLARFDEGNYQALMLRAARRHGDARRKAYAELDLQLGRDAAPLVPLDVLNEATFVSSRVGCVVLRPGLVLTSVCLKR